MDTMRMDYGDKVALLARLFGEVVGPIESGGKMWLPVTVPVVEPGKMVPIRVRSQVTFRPRRLVILEPVVERRVKEDVAEQRDWHTTVTPMYHPLIQGRKWAQIVVDYLVGTPHRVDHHTATTTRIVTLRSERVPRGAWRVSGMFAGAFNCFPNAPAGDGLSGDEFGPSAVAEHFHDVLHAGMDVTIAACHVCDEPVPFMAVIVGDPVERRTGGADEFTP